MRERARLRNLNRQGASQHGDNNSSETTKTVSRNSDSIDSNKDTFVSASFFPEKTDASKLAVTQKQQDFKVPSLMGYYSFNWPRRDGRLSWPCWLTDSGRRIHKVVKQPSISLAQDEESPPAGTNILTTMLRHHDDDDDGVCRIQKQAVLLVACEDGWLYMFSIEPLASGNECLLLFQHRSVYLWAWCEVIMWFHTVIWWC